jgi:mannan endo-1,4-beta-mannosidase
MFWQLLTEGMDSFRDGYEVVFSQNPSTTSVIVDQSQKLNRIRKMYARLRNIEKWKRAKDIRNNGN